MSRSVAREVACQLVYEYLFLKCKNENTFNNLCEENKFIKNDKDFVKVLYDGIIENFDHLENEIKNSVKDFSFSQVVKMDFAILLVAFYELLFTQTDKPIIINEALNIAKKFSTDKSSSFINGVISSFIRK